MIENNENIYNTIPDAQHAVPAQEETYEQLSMTQLLSLLNDPSYEEQFVTVQTRGIVQGIDDMVKTMTKQRGKEISALADTIALDSLRQQGHTITSIPEARALGKTWGVIRETTQGQAREAVQAQLATEPEVMEIRQRLQEEREARRTQLIRVREEAIARQHDQDLLNALAVWGMSRDADTTVGNAGVIHYFAYRANPEKAGRYNFSRPFSINAFIDFSQFLKSLVDNPDPDNNPDVRSAALLQDELGQKRLLLISKYNFLIVGFQRADDNIIRIITAIPGQKIEKFKENVEAELHEVNEGRYNKLGEHPHLVVFKEAPNQ